MQGEWAESGDTVEGRYRHRRVDKPGGKLPDPQDAEESERIHARSITLSSNRLGLIAKMDLVEGEGNVVCPVDYKRGKRPHVPRGAYDPERIQLCVQGNVGKYSAATRRGRIDGVVGGKPPPRKKKRRLFQPGSVSRRSNGRRVTRA